MPKTNADDNEKCAATPIRYLEHCLFCFGRNSCSLRFTKHGKPYLVCQLCMSRAFLNRLDGLRGPAIVPLLISDARASGSLLRHEERFHEMATCVTKAMSDQGAPEAPRPIPYSVEPAAEHGE